MQRFLSFAAILILVIGTSKSGECRRHDLAFALQLAGSHDSIIPDSAVWKAGEPVRVIVTMINRLKRDVHYSLTNPGQDWQMDVRDSEGKPVGETDLFRQMKENMKNGTIILSRNIIGTLRPNETKQDTVEVDMFYDLRKPGEYSIQIQREFPDVAREPIKSNRLKLTITP